MYTIFNEKPVSAERVVISSDVRVGIPRQIRFVILGPLVAACVLPHERLDQRPVLITPPTTRSSNAFGNLKN